MYCSSFCVSFFFFYCYGDHRDLHSFPTRRSSDLAVDRDEVRDLLRPGEEFPFLVREVELPRPLRVRIPHGPRGPAEHGQEAGLTVGAFWMVGHLPNPNLLMEVSAFEAQQVHGLG